ncbi:glycosyltransferase, partial [Candidatus Sumerlaeota bacterium]|nr:glycosyltransferase [Candidatus Sumerlaeota bacterium]
DGTYGRLRELQKTHPQIRILRHRVNSGESAGELTGFRHARGKMLVTIDADLQNDPADIPSMLARLETCDVVCGMRRKREDSWLKKVSSRVANWFRNAMLHDSIHDAGCTYRAMRRRAVEIELLPFKGMHRFLPTIWKLHGFRVEEISVNHRPRFKGVSKYGLWNRLGVGLSDIKALRWYRKRRLNAPRLSESDSDLSPR